MTSNDTSSASPKTQTQLLVTYEQLLTEPKRLRQVVSVLGSQGWEDLEQWFLAERQAHLEASVDSDDPDAQTGHRVVARWLKHFLTIGKEELVSLERARREPSTQDGDDHYMDFDASTKQETGGPNGSDPESPRGIHQG